MRKVIISIGLLAIFSLTVFGVVSCKDNTHVHSMESVAAVEAACTEDGNIAYYKCSVCGKYFSDADGKEEITVDSVVVPAKGHSLESVAAVDATCVDAGNIAYYKCSVCGKYFSDADGKNEITADSVVVPAKGHSLESIAAVDATCEATGNIAYYKCSVCGKYFSDADGQNEITADSVVVPAKGHSLESIAAVGATCVDAGNIAYYKCSVCGKYFSDADGKNEITADSVVVPAKGHSLESIAAVDATCVDAGNIAYYKCSVCGKYFSDEAGKNEITADSVVVPAKGHSLESVAAVDATCDATGNIAYYKCSVCGKYFSDADGKEEITVDSVVIPAKGHEIVSVPAVDTTCEATGNIAYYKCSVCGKYFSDADGKNEISADSVVVPAKGHTIVSVEVREATCSEVGIKVACYQCSVCGKYFSDEAGQNELAEEDVAIPTIDHTYSAEVVTEPTATSEGSAILTCSVCGYKEEIVLPVLTEENYENGTYNYQLVYQYNEDKFDRYAEYTYAKISLSNELVFKTYVSSIKKASRYGSVSVQSGSMTGQFLSMYASATSLDGVTSGLEIQNFSDSYYKFSITTADIMLDVALICSDGTVTDFPVTIDSRSFMFELNTDYVYYLVFFGLSSRTNIDYKLEKTTVPTISLSKTYICSNLAGGNIYAGQNGGSIVVLIDSDVVEGDYNIYMEGALAGRGNFIVEVNGVQINTVPSASPVGAMATIHIKAGDFVTIISQNLNSMSFRISLKSA